MGTLKLIDILFATSTSAVLASSIFIFLRGKKQIAKDTNKGTLVKQTKRSYVPLFLVVNLLALVFILTSLYTKQLEKDQEKIDELLSINLATRSFTNDDKSALLDSLKEYRNALTRLEVKLDKQNKIAGNAEYTLVETNKRINSTTQQIATLQTYNEVVPIPEAIHLGYVSHGTAYGLNFVCPTDTLSDYLDLILSFDDSKLVNKIEVIYLEVAEKREFTKNEYDHIYSQAYKPQIGTNKIRIKNYLKERNIEMRVGYFLKSELKTPNPRIESVTCRRRTFSVSTKQL